MTEDRARRVRLRWELREAWRLLERDDIDDDFRRYLWRLVPRVAAELQRPSPRRKRRRRRAAVAGFARHGR